MQHNIRWNFDFLQACVPQRGRFGALAERCFAEDLKVADTDAEDCANREDRAGGALA